MPMRRHPNYLRDAALNSVIGLVTYRVRRIITSSAQTHSRTFASINVVLTSLPDSLAGKVVAAAISCADNLLHRNNHPARRVLDRLLQVVLTAGTRSFSLPLAESYSLRVALLRRLAALNGLRELRLSESLHLHTSIELALNGLQRMEHLIVLHAPWIFSDEMAGVVGSSCPHLQVLDASDSARLTDRSIDNLVRCENLRVLLLSGCRITAQGYERFLAQLRRLERIGRCQQLGSIVSRLSTEDTPLRLTAFESDHVPDAKVTKLCPALSWISVSDVIVVPSSEGLRLPVNVQMLQIERVGSRDHPLELQLDFEGSSLTHIDIMEYVISAADVVRLGVMCPDLQVLRLALTANWTQVQTTHANISPCGVGAPFRRLQEFRLYCGPSGVLQYVLGFARDIRTVTVLQPSLSETQCSLTDTQMKEICALNPMKKLRQFCMLDSACLLTMDSVYVLLGSCPELRELHDLREWKVTESQIEELQEVITNNNWDLDLWSHMAKR